MQQKQIKGKQGSDPNTHTEATHNHLLLEDLRPLVSSGTCIHMHIPTHTLSQGYYCWMKHHDQSNFGKKGLLGLRVIITVSKGRNQGQELKQGRNCVVV